MLTPVEVSRTDSTITISWSELTGSTTGNSPITSYNLYWDNNTGTSSIELTDSLVTQWTVTGLSSSGIYKFKVRANNIYGYGDFSDESSFEASHNPGKTDIPTVTLSGTSVQVSWTEPDPHGSPILAYEILFKKADGSYVSQLTDCDGAQDPVLSAKTCFIPMTSIPTLTDMTVDTLI